MTMAVGRQVFEGGGAAMAAAYSIRPIAGDDVDGAFVLARLSMPSSDLEDWRERVDRSRSMGAEEITVAVNPPGYVQGLTISRVLPEGVLEVPAFVVVSAADAPGVGIELLGYLKARAARAGCRTMAFHRPGRDPVVLPVAGSGAELDLELFAPDGGT